MRSSSPRAPRPLQAEVPSIEDLQGWSRSCGGAGDSCPAGDRCALAPSRIQSVLDLALVPSSSHGQETCQPGIARTHISHGCREPNVGCHTHPRLLCGKPTARTSLTECQRCQTGFKPKTWECSVTAGTEQIPSGIHSDTAGPGITPLRLYWEDVGRLYLTANTWIRKRGWGWRLFGYLHAISPGITKNF